MTQLDTKETFQVPYIIRQCLKICRNWTTNLIHEKLLENALADFLWLYQNIWKEKLLSWLLTYFANTKLNCIKSNFLFHHPNLDCRCLMPNALFGTPHTYVRVERQVNCSKVKVRKFLPQQQWKVNQTHMCPLIYDTFPPPILVVYLTSKEDSKWLGIHCCMTRLLSTHLERKTFFRRWKVKVYKKKLFFTVTHHVMKVKDAFLPSELLARRADL